MQINAEKCLAVGGMKILGYKIQEKKYAIDQDEAPIVKKIFQETFRQAQEILQKTRKLLREQKLKESLIC